MSSTHADIDLQGFSFLGSDLQQRLRREYGRPLIGSESWRTVHAGNVNTGFEAARQNSTSYAH